MLSLEKLWTKNFILSGLVNLLAVLVFYMLVVVIAGYAVTELGATKAQAGLISGLFIVGTLIGRLVVNQVIDRIGRKATLWSGLIGVILSSSLYLVNFGIDFLVFVRFFHGFSFGLASTVIGTVIAQIIPVARRAEGIGYYSLSSTLGTAIGPFLGLFLLLHTSYHWIFISTIVFSVLSFIVCLWIQLPPLPEQKFKINYASKEKHHWLDNIIEVKAIPIGIVVLICAVCYSSVLSFISFYAEDLNLEQAASLFFLVYAFAILASRPVTGKLMDRKGENMVMYPALITLSIALVLLSIADSSVMFLISAALLGLGFGNMQSIAQTISVKQADLSRMGLATSTFFIALDAGLGFGPFALGILLNYMSYQHMYFWAGIVCTLTIGIYYLLHGRKAAL